MTGGIGSTADVPETVDWPRWLNELDRTVAVRPQFVVSGNIRDVFLVPTAEGPVLQPILPSLFEALRRRGIEFLLVYDRVDGLRVFPETSAPPAAQRLNVQVGQQISREALVKTMRRVVGARDVPPCALVIDYASRVAARPQSLQDGELEFFAACEKIAQTAQPLRPPGQDQPAAFNSVIWLINRANDIPDWFIVGNESVHTVVASLPDRQTRMVAALNLAGSFALNTAMDATERVKFAGVFADLTDGLTLRSMLAISQLARDQGIALAGIADAVRLYKVGIPDNPWRQDYLKEKIRTGAETIGQRIKGQDQAVRKTLDILTRSVMGLSGAQASVGGGRPRGVLFFAGPTGVGKTELAKAVTQLVFGDDQAYKRFDMSEFAAEHSDARLLGAPPGYVGHDAGGELVNAVRQRPFSVLLFDEIEKAHPRILDKFLQVLEDGRLTDGRGDTVFFSELVIVFTSNLGVYIEREDGTRVQNVAPSTPTAEVERKIRSAIDHHFRFKLQRPELLNRIGDNIIVFDFIRPEVATAIFDRMLANVIERVRDEHAIAVEVSAEARERLLALCTQDLGNGGRGIGNRLESVLINPLARSLFELSPSRGATVTIRGHREEQGVHTLELA